MVIEHVAMYVNDLERARDFFVRFLNGRSNDGYHNSPLRRCAVIPYRWFESTRKRRYCYRSQHEVD